MSRKDKLTGRVVKTGNSRSKAMNITKRAWQFNIQTVTFVTKKGKRVRITTSAKNLRTIRKKGIDRFLVNV